jgi:hypothetical protein
VLYEVKYEFWYTGYTNFSLQSHPTLQQLASFLVSKRIVLDSWASPRELCGCHSGIGTGYSPNISVFLFQYYSTFFSYSHSSSKSKQGKEF